MRFAGYASLFGIADAANDTVLPGAFNRTLRERSDPIPLFWQHKADKQIGWVEAAQEDSRGLCVVARIDRPDGHAATLLSRRSVTGLSFGYRARQFRNVGSVRHLEDIDLFEVSLVTHPLQHAARVHLVAY